MSRTQSDHDDGPSLSTIGRSLTVITMPGQEWITALRQQQLSASRAGTH